MFSPNDPVQCPHCNKTWRERDLRAEHVVLLSCPSCGSAIREEQGSVVQDEGATAAGDVAAIDAWLDGVKQADGLTVRPVRDREAMGDYLWSVEGLPFPWQCEVLYMRAYLRTVDVYLRTSQAADKVLANSDKLLVVCASLGLQGRGQSGPKNWWGAGQVLKTSSLLPALFHPLVDRLDQVMREVLTAFA